tara:strand:+ start:1443 stop:2423 length:981 start_codon:yes stop_codon:yes gene_type:complete
VNYNYQLFLEEYMKKIISTTFVTILLGISLSGCLGDGLFSNEENSISITSPTWTKGDFWEYSIKTPGLEISTTMVVSIDDDDTDYYIGTGSLEDAKRHAVLNYNPAIGRIQMSDFSIYEKNIPQLILDFPLEKDKVWSFGLYGKEEFNAIVNDVKGNVAHIIASSPDGARIDYTYDREARWLSNFTFVDSNGEYILEMKLANYGKGFTGNSYFCRGGDLYDEQFTGPDVSVYDTIYINEGHERYGDWDYIIYFLNADIGSSGGGELVLRDHLETDILVETLSPGTSMHEMGTVGGSSGNWTFEISLSGNAEVRMRIAGAIQYTYAV